LQLISVTYCPSLTVCADSIDCMQYVTVCNVTTVGCAWGHAKTATWATCCTAETHTAAAPGSR